MKPTILDVAEKLGIGYRNSGKYRKCRCFMHEDRHPSMWLNTGNDTWYCPVCSKGGDAVALVMQHQSMTFTEACEWLETEFHYRESRYNGRRKKIGCIRHITRRLPPTPPSAPVPLDSQYVRRCRSNHSTFCRTLVSNGILTQQQMEHAAERYRLGITRDGGVVFWNIDSNQRVLEGKIMWYGDDCHRDHQRHPSTVSHRLIMSGRLPKDWKSSRCLFGLHLLPSVRDSIVAIVESEKTAVICSELIDYPGITWMATGGMGNLSAQLLRPLAHHRIILFPDTDTTGTAFSRWSSRAREISTQLGTPIYVSDLLEINASPEQKEQKIDIADWSTFASDS